MLLMHPDTLKRLQGILPAVVIDGAHLPIERFEVQTSDLIPSRQKTGKLIWPVDPFVTYEDADRSWGLALGIAREEEIDVVYEFTESYFPATFAPTIDFFKFKIGLGP